MENRIILPLDNIKWADAKEIIKKTSGLVWGYKVRKVLLEKGLKIIPSIARHGKVMVDFKLYDIPSAITESLREHFINGTTTSTVHCTADYSSEDSMLIPPIKIAGVTILTSMKFESFSKYYKGPEIIDTVREMVKSAVDKKYGYIVCSPLELEFLQEMSIAKICPGIRPMWYDKDDDQDRVSSPSYAIKNGATHLVIGRPILNNVNMVDAIKRTNDEINSAIDS